jgi:ATP-dependent protease Clp ATPase subunit
MIRFTQLRCSFCWKKSSEVSKLVAGRRAYICDVCVAIATEFMNNSPTDNQPPTLPSTWRKLLNRVAQIIRGDRAQRVFKEVRHVLPAVQR